MGHFLMIPSYLLYRFISIYLLKKLSVIALQFKYISLINESLPSNNTVLFHMYRKDLRTVYFQFLLIFCCYVCTFIYAINIYCYTFCFRQFIFRTIRKQEKNEFNFIFIDSMSSTLISKFQSNVRIFPPEELFFFKPARNILLYACAQKNPTKTEPITRSKE